MLGARSLILLPSRLLLKRHRNSCIKCYVHLERTMAKKPSADGFKLPKRTLVSEAEAAKFTGEQQARESRLRRTELGERLTVYLPPGLAKDLRVRCASERRSVSDAVTEAVGAWIRVDS